MKRNVLIIGASGVFGSRLVERAACEPGLRLTLGGRNRARQQALEPVDLALIGLYDLSIRGHSIGQPGLYIPDVTH